MLRNPTSLLAQDQIKVIYWKKRGSMCINSIGDTTE